MPQRHVDTVTQGGVTPTQPGVSVSATTFNGSTTLHVTRHYNLVNGWGGIGRIHHLDCDDIEFPNGNAAHDFALQRGYLHEWFPRAYASTALRAAEDTLKRGGYKGNRKLTHHLLRVVEEMKSKGTWASNWFKFDLNWTELR